MPKELNGALQLNEPPPARVEAVEAPADAALDVDALFNADGFRAELPEFDPDELDELPPDMDD